jgi:uroporphyrinogen-III synthase
VKRIGKTVWKLPHHSAPLKVKSILVTQPKPESEKSPYHDLAKKYNLKIDFRPFIHIEGIQAKDFRKDKVNIPDFTAVILTSRHAADHFFRICNEMRITNTEELKYFCISESTAFYLQKYITFRKRKIFSGKQNISDLLEILKKHKKEYYWQIMFSMYLSGFEKWIFISYHPDFLQFKDLRLFSIPVYYNQKDIDFMIERVEEAEYSIMNDLAKKGIKLF